MPRKKKIKRSAKSIHYSTPAATVSLLLRFPFRKWDSFCGFGWLKSARFGLECHNWREEKANHRNCCLKSSNNLLDLIRPSYWLQTRTPDASRPEVLKLFSFVGPLLCFLVLARLPAYLILIFLQTQQLQMHVCYLV